MPRKKPDKTNLQNPFRMLVEGVAAKAPNAADATTTGDAVWAYPPPSLDDFVTGEGYLGLPPLSSRQLRVFHEGLERDGADLFSSENSFNELVLCWGKGSGKDYVSSIIISYIAYIVCCLKNPQKFFDLAPNEPLDIVNVATREQQAKDVFFDKLTSQIRRPCFAKFKPRILGMKIEFLTKSVRLHSLHSRAQRWEGYNLLAWVMDEADAFQTQEGNQNAEEVYKVLKSSARTRFPHMRWIGIIISYPRSERGFMLTHVDQMRKLQAAYVDVAPTWEVHPFYDPAHPSFKNFPMVQIEQYTVPEPYVEDFRLDPVGSAMAYMCIPPPLQFAFFEFPELIDDCASLHLEPAIWVQPTTTYHLANVIDQDPLNGDLIEVEKERKFTALYIVRKVRDLDGYICYVHGDPGETHDAFALCLAHTLPDTAHVQTMDLDITLNHVQVDLMLEWLPKHNEPVDFLNVRDVIMQLVKWFPVMMVTFDKFQSAQVYQELLQAGINAKQMSFSNAQQLQMFRTLKAMVYNKMVQWPAAHHEKLIRPQLRYLMQKGGKITHDEALSYKDAADALAAACWHASGASMGRNGRDILESIYGTSASDSTGMIRRKIGA